MSYFICIETHWKHRQLNYNEEFHDCSGDV